MESETGMRSGSLNIVEISDARRPGRHQASAGGDRLGDQDRQRTLSMSEQSGAPVNRYLLTSDGLGLSSLLEYEIRSSSRHRHFVALVMMAAGSGDGDFRVLLGDTIRDSDGFFVSDGEAVIVMGETDQSGAIRAAMRFRERTDDRCDVRFGVSSYPMDGQTGAELLAKGRRRLRRAMGLKRGAVVASE